MRRSVILFVSLLAASLSIAPPVPAQPGISYSATPTTVCRWMATKAGTAQRKGQLLTCPPDAPRSVLLAALAAPVAAPAPAPSAPAAAPRPIGMNLASVTGSEDPFLDRMLTSQGWRATLWGAPVAGNLTLDATGAPAALPAGANNVSTLVSLDPPSLFPNQRYVVTFKGKAFFGGPGVVVLEQACAATCRYVFTAPFEYQSIGFSDPDPTNFPRDIHLVRADQEAQLAAGGVFNPAFVDASARWSVLRFMDWSNTNGSQVVTWADRATPAARSSYVGDVPIEVEIRLANETHVDPWLNIPAHADDDYVRQLATYARDHLDPALKLHLEYSNEVWNGSFEQAQWAKAQAVTRWNITDWGNETFYGYRAAQVAAIARPILGDRLKMVLAVFTAWWGVENNVFDGIARAGGTDALFDEYAVTTYWGDGLQSKAPADHALVLGWARAGQTGVDAAFDAIEDGKALSAGTRLADLPASYRYHKGIADKHNLKLVAYEGGFGVQSAFMPTDEQDEVTAFFQRMEASPRMGVAIKRMVDDFLAAGGTRLSYFNDAGATTKWGTWPAAPSIYGTSQKLEALKVFNAAAR